MNPHTSPLCRPRLGTNPSSVSEHSSVDSAHLPHSTPKPSPGGSWHPLTLPSVSLTVFPQIASACASGSSSCPVIATWVFMGCRHTFPSPLRLWKLTLSDSLLPPSTERIASAQLQHESRQESARSMFRSEIAHKQSCILSRPHHLPRGREA